jgi:type I restriction enzyme M protein
MNDRIEKQRARFLETLESLGGSAGNIRLRSSLGWQEKTYNVISESLKRDDLVSAGRGRGGSVALVNGTHARPASHAESVQHGAAAQPKADGARATAKAANGGKAKVVQDKSLETWIWDAACSIRGAKDAPKYKDFILPLIFAKRLCDVFDDEVNRIADKVGSRAKAFRLVKLDKQLVRFYLPLEPQNPEAPVWSVIRTLSNKIGEQLTTHLRAIADDNPALKGIIDRVDFNATTHGVRDLDDDRLSNLIEAISAKRLGLKDVEPDIIGRSYEYLIRKFAEGSVSSAGEFYTPKEVGFVMARIMEPGPGMEIYDPCCGSAGLLIKCELVLAEKMTKAGKRDFAPVKLYGQEYTPETWAMANMNMIIHDMEGLVELGDTFKNPKFRRGNRLQTFDRVVANPMWNQDWWRETDYDADEFDRFPKGAGYPGTRADWGWAQIIFASLKPEGRATIVLDTGALSRGSRSRNASKEKEVRRWFVDNDLIEGVIQLPENLFYNTPAPGIILVLSKSKPQKRQQELILINATAHYAKGDPKNYLPEDVIKLISDTFNDWKEKEEFSRIVGHDDIEKNDYNLSPAEYISSIKTAKHRSIDHILKELTALEIESEKTNEVIKGVVREIEF